MAGEPNVSVSNTTRNRCGRGRMGAQQEQLNIWVKVKAVSLFFQHKEKEYGI